MANVIQGIREWFYPVHPLPAGLYHYISPPEDPRNYRLHLRLEKNGSGILIVNASTILHLNQTAAELAYYIIQNLSPEKAASKIASRYHVTKDQARSDYENLIDRIQILINTPDLDPETFLDFERKPVHTASISAPYRLDCAITYRLPDLVDPQLAPTDRVKQELSAQDWEKIIDKAAKLGIPHILFTGGEPTLRPDLPELIGYAEKDELVTGLISDCLRLGEADYMNHVLQKGLDHVMMVLNPELPESWKALDDLLAADIFVAVHITLTQENADSISELIRRLSQLGVRAISLSVNDPELKDKLENARNQVANEQIELIWNLPVPYSSMNPIAIETSEWNEFPGAGLEWLYVEPDGDVLPSQGMNQVLGNLLNDSWETIWKK